MKTFVEIYLGKDNNGSGYGTWYTDYVQVEHDPDLSKDEIGVIGLNQAILEASQRGEEYAFIGIYNIHDPETSLMQD